MQNQSAKKMALGGVLAALAVVIMCLGGLIPASTYICPMLGVLILNYVLFSCGKRTAWAWFGTVSILTCLMGPDKEAAFVFLALGYYPIIRPWFFRRKWVKLFQIGYFTLATCLMYYLMIHLLGLPELKEEFAEIGRWMTLFMLVFGNVIFLMLERLLQLMNRKLAYGRK